MFSDVNYESIMSAKGFEIILWHTSIQEDAYIQWWFISSIKFLPSATVHL